MLVFLTLDLRDVCMVCMLCAYVIILPVNMTTQLIHLISLPVTATTTIIMSSDHRSGSTSFLFSIPSCFFFIILVLFSLSSFSLSANALLMTSHSQQCLDLLDLKKGFDLFYASTSLSDWLPGTDCCWWEGVFCDQVSGLVVSLDLSERHMGGNIMPCLFNLTSLQRLNLAYNGFNHSAVLHLDFEKLTNLTHLNLSYSGIDGQVPMGISRLTKLISLDLSSDIYSLMLEKPDLGTLIRDLFNLEELYLDHVNISSSGTEWCHAISDSTPGLQALSLQYCSLLGPIDSSLSKLRNLSILRLDGNDLLSQVPDFFAKFSSLTVLSLSWCGLKGLFPKSVFELLNLKTIDLSYNSNLTGFLPEFPLNSSLETLTISYTTFLGPIPLSIWNLSELVYLDLSSNHLSGHLPPMLAGSKISIINLSSNYFIGQIPSTLGHAHHLTSLYLVDNLLTGSIPMSLFTLPILKELYLADNKLSGQLQEFTNASSTLQYVDLGGNNLQGKLPKSLVDLSALGFLVLGSNNFDGSVMGLELFGHLQNLTYLDLSGIDMSISDGIAGSSVLFPSLHTLTLQSCNLTVIPSFLKHKKNFGSLDLSNNRINGIIPRWIWSIGSFIESMNFSYNSFTDIEKPFLKHSNNVEFLDLSSNRIGGTIPSWLWSSGVLYLNLSCNLFTSVEGSFSNPSTVISIIIDLHSNLLQGPIPLPPPNSTFVDYSNNLFTSSIPFNISYYLKKTIFFSLSNNSLTGEVPSSICSATKLYIFDISHNNLSGSIPACLFESLIDLRVLNARENSFQGSMPQKVSSRCAIQTINLNGNKLEGVIPSSWANCAELEVLDLGRNKLADSFPHWLMNLPALKVLVLKENKFFGHLTGICEGNHSFMMLQIFDISSNHFTGSLPSECFKSMKAMIVPQGQTETIGYRNGSLRTYQDTIMVDLKGFEIELVKILTTFTSIDLSNNRFVGNIPQVLGDLKSLHALNMALNAFTGEIPRVLGDLSELESLDLSGNQLSGVIPSSLTSLYFLAFLNLSNNNLVGKIPQSFQFSTFSNSSFEGNPGLCGSPLSRDCINSTSVEPSSDSENAPTEFDMDEIWFWMFTGLGYGVGFALAIIYQLFFPKWRMWYKRRFMSR
ncbi:receptor-like protein 7 [Dioscorea cayenensis subsp. rotundata]|uniref:Receptor-like protein 7 n=1 Tax=Dioscorea cayennensis subsp. rotundata TaxID=55577 RepID=A0AB40BQ96_DIOCR|nr:receptor-like protein 7 [Dioscorea cayenensis subsp. rotundata]